MTKKAYNYKKATIILILVSTIVRIFISAIPELGPTEAYYKSFALFPELSNFDQPPMIGWIIQLFTTNLSFNHELFVRIGAVFCGTASSWVVFVTGRRMFSEASGFYSSLIFNTSLYMSLFTGTLIIPEAPQTLFYLLTIYFVAESLIPRNTDKEEAGKMSDLAFVLAGIFAGLALLSKYSSIFIWPAVLVYAIIQDRKHFFNKSLYISLAISLIFLIPAYIWNFGYNFPGIEYIKSTFTLYTPFSATTFYDIIILIVLINPMILATVVRGLKIKDNFHGLEHKRKKLLLILTSTMGIATFFISLFSPEFIYSLPIMLFPAVYVATHKLSKLNHRFIRNYTKKASSYYFFIILMIVINYSTGLSNYNPFFKHTPLPNSHFSSLIINNYGWREFSEKFRLFLDSEESYNKTNNYFIIDNNYKSAALKDYYLGNPNNMIVKTAGQLSETRKYALITQKEGFFKYGESAYFIGQDISEKEALDFGRKYFNHTEIASVIYIKRFNYPVKKFVIYRFKDIVRLPNNYLNYD